MAQQAKQQDKQSVKKSSSNIPLAHGVGRRKAAIARVWLKRGKGNILVNESAHSLYFDTDPARKAAEMPFAVYPQGAELYDVNVNVIGGGLRAQADALKLGLARALCEINPDVKPLFRDRGLLTVDSRVKERKKYGQRGARRKFQFVKR